jgi:phage terminase large subunit-like protein
MAPDLVTEPRKARKTRKGRDYKRVAEEFERAVLDGSFPCGALFRAAVERQRKDLDRSARGELPYKFDATVGERVCKFVELLPHVEGAENLVSTKIRLEPWQVWAVLVSFSWVSRVSGYPRFRRITLFMPKGQGKTLLCAAIAVYVLATEKGASTVLSAATTRDQARQAFDAARHMLIRSPELCERFGLVVEEHAIKRPATGTKYVPVSSEARSAEGKLPRLIVEDEIHIHAKRDLHDNLRSMAAKRPDSQTLVISTAGFDMSPQAIGYEVYSYARDILDGSVKDDSQFALLIEADRDDDPWSEATWRKANPNYGVSIDPVEVANEANEAKQRPLKQPSFLTKRLGRWVNSSAKWIAPADWEACVDPSLKIEDFHKRQAFIGADMGDTRDLTATVRVFVDMRADGKRTYSVFAKAYLPEESVTLSEGNDALRVWAEQGWITLTPGRSMGEGMSELVGDLLSDAETFPNSELCYDPWRAATLVESVGHALVPVVIRQGAQTQSEPMRELEAAILDRRLRHDGNPVLAWCMGNVIPRADRNGNIAPDREGESKKIDCAVALINAFVRAYVNDDDTFTSGGLISL